MDLNAIFTFGIPIIVAYTLIKRRLRAHPFQLGDVASWFNGYLPSPNPQVVEAVSDTDRTVAVEVEQVAPSEFIIEPVFLPEPEPEPIAAVIHEPPTVDDLPDEPDEGLEDEDEDEDDEEDEDWDDDDEEEPEDEEPATIRPTAPSAGLQQLRAALKTASTPANWINEVLANVVHMFVLGGTGGGKTILLQYMVTQLHAMGWTVLVGDPDAAEGDWPGAVVVGGGDNFPEIDQALKYATSLALARRQQRAAGQRDFEPFALIIDEYADVQGECAGAGKVVNNALRRWRKLNMHLFIGVQDSQAKTLGFERQTHLLINATMVRVAKAESGTRYAKVGNAPARAIPHIVIDRSVDLPEPELPDIPSATPLHSNDDEGAGSVGGDGDEGDLFEDDLSERDRAILAILRLKPESSSYSIFQLVGGERTRTYDRIERLRDRVAGPV